MVLAISFLFPMFIIAIWLRDKWCMYEKNEI